MGYNTDNYKRLMNEYNSVLSEETSEALKRRDEIHNLIPEIANIDKALSEVAMSIMTEIGNASADRAERIEKYKSNIYALQSQRKDLLISHGYPTDYTDIKYRCNECHDTGFVGTNMCKCLKRALTIAGYESSGIGKLIKTQSFDNFSLNYCRESEECEHSIRHALESSRIYAEGFDEKTAENLLFIGTTGSGKTHLCTSIAKAVIDKGFDVVYNTAPMLISDFQKERFGTNMSGGMTDTSVSSYYNCDLLIIDDLGSEISNAFSVSVLFNLINTRLCSSKPIIINTNLTPKELRAQYQDRLTSRLLGDFTLFAMKCPDVRLQKLKI